MPSDHSPLTIMPDIRAVPYRCGLYRDLLAQPSFEFPLRMPNQFNG